MRAGPTSDEYFQYVAVVAEEDDAKFCCVVFGLVEQCLSAFSGHFLVPKERLFDPVNKIPASEIAVMPSERCEYFICERCKCNCGDSNGNIYCVSFSSPSHGPIRRAQ